MSGPVMIAHLLLERISRKCLERIPESHCIMDDPAQVQAFNAIVSDQGLLVPINFYHALQASSLLKPGETVLELACGPGGQLIRMAQLNPANHFIGLDASAGMLEIARTSVDTSGVQNVELLLGDMSRLDRFADASVDCIVCAMSLHHLPDLLSLNRFCSEVHRVLKPDGGLYISDFGRFKRKSTQNFFAHDRSSEQSPQFTQDYAESLAAAFSVDEIKSAMQIMNHRLEFYPTILAPFMLILKTATRRTLDLASRQRVSSMYQSLTSLQQRDFNNIARWFKMSGYDLPLKLS
jgi:ubiquinone/menaquinone biosynthesis C-methylase UbiE